MTLVSTGEKLIFALAAPHHAYGAALRVEFPETSSPFKIRIDYETSPTASAVQWLRPEQTAGKSHPYLFTQCQAIHARSMLPCQDSPGVKIPYTASITVPETLTALMSAVATGSTSNSDGTKTYTFEQRVPIPSYLTALVIGALESR